MLHPPTAVLVGLFVASFDHVKTDAEPKSQFWPSEHIMEALAVPDVPCIVPVPPFLFSVIVFLQSDCSS